MHKKYFIDSENVGDNWIALLKYLDAKDELLVFYTNKSPYMSYDSVICLRESDKNISFIKCHEGNNALDFQLSTHLGYCVHDMENDEEFIIVSNDTGFDAVVKYWCQKNILISRMTGKECKMEESETGNPIPLQQTVSEPMKTLPADDTNTTEKSLLDKQANEILYILGKNDLQRLHSALVAIFGDKLGKQYYNAFKSNLGYDHFISKHAALKPKEKQNLYCSIVFSVTGSGIQMPKGFSDFIIKSWNSKKNLNSLRASLQGKYGKDKYELYYKIIKAHVKILYKIQ